MSFDGMGQEELFWIRFDWGWPGVEISRSEPSQTQQGLAFPFYPC